MSEEILWNKPKDLDSLDSIPTSWVGFTRADKVQKYLDVIQDQLAQVRQGSFNVKKGSIVASLALEAQMELADFYADAEASAKDAKNTIEYIESEVACKFVEQVNTSKDKPTIKVTEAAIQRYSAASTEVKQSKKDYVQLEREHKKWKCVYEILKDAHIFFRNIDKL